MKPNLKSVTLVCIDTTNKVHLAERALEKSLEQADFTAVKLLTDDTTRKWAVKIPKINGLEGYSNFIVRELHKYISSTHCLVVQYDGYVLNGAAWTDDFLKFDYIGAPSWGMNMAVGNGGFSLRSLRLLTVGATHALGENCHPEDAWLCFRHKHALEAKNIQFAPPLFAKQFSFEGRSYDGHGWHGTPNQYCGSFGFHSWLTPLPETMDKPMIFHHTGDTGDIIYSLPVMKALGGGVLFISPDSRYPYPRPCRVTPTAETVNNIACLTNQQDYVWNTLWTHGLPFSTDVDFNMFRDCYRVPGLDHWASLFSLHQKPFGVTWPEDKPWLDVDAAIKIPGRDIVVNRTERFHNEFFPWAQLVIKHGHRMVFIGSPEEYQTFRGFGLPQIDIPYQPTPTLLEVARFIKGAKVFVGNQSAPMAIALGLGVNIVQETWPGNPNCRLKRDNAIYCSTDKTEIPDSWLK